MIDGVPKIEIIESIRMPENMIGELFGNLDQEIVSDAFAASSKVILERMKERKNKSSTAQEWTRLVKSKISFGRKLSFD